jgi:hypothetical protein
MLNLLLIYFKWNIQIFFSLLSLVNTGITKPIPVVVF